MRAFTLPKIIAEVAQGYEGRPDYCRLFVRIAAKAKANAVKFQIVYADDTAEPGYVHYEFFKQLQMDVAIWQELRALTKSLGMQFVCDVSGQRAIKVARAIRPDGIKLHSSNFFNRALLREAFECADRVFVSLGGAHLAEIEALVAEVTAWGCVNRLVLLCGFQAEPTPVEKSNLARIPMLLRKFPMLEIGYMDHVAGGTPDHTHVSIMAMVLGTHWIEKHLTITRFGEIEDYISALDPEEFASYVAALARLADASGEADLELGKEELAYRDKSVKKLITARALDAGHVLTAADIEFKRTPRIAPYSGIHDPRFALGRKVARPLAAGEPILEPDLR